MLSSFYSHAFSPISNVEWEKMKKQTYDLEERLLIKHLRNSTTH